MATEPAAANRHAPQLRTFWFQAVRMEKIGARAEANVGPKESSRRAEPLSCRQQSCRRDRRGLAGTHQPGLRTVPQALHESASPPVARIDEHEPQADRPLPGAIR